jgi:predicted RNase H-like nuclease (RuvC/YqgF family)
MNEELLLQLTATAERLATAAEALDRVLGRFDAQQEALNTKVDRIVAAVEDKVTAVAGDLDTSRDLQRRITELEKANSDLQSQAARLTRKTLSPLTSALLAKSAGDGDSRVDAAALDKTLQSLSVEQRIAVKAEMARAGIIE